ncbi:penicillin acylase family protein, partial [Streptomyces hyaluromycini]
LCRRARVAVELRMARAMVGSHARCTGRESMPGLESEVRLRVGSDGVTAIEAGSWLDAVRALGHVMSRDRGFQLDLMRRTASGRLSEVFGRGTLAVDRRYRPLDLAAAADRAAACLDAPERELLEAFAAGVNVQLASRARSFESRFLSYTVPPWSVADSLLVALYLFHGLSWNEEAKRAEAVIRRALPAPVAEFLLPEWLSEGDAGVPEELRRLREAGVPEDGLVSVDQAVAGSNCWIRGGPEGPLLACDLHLPLAMPNVLYEVDLTWPGHRVRGLAAPGLPVVLTGTNGHLAWGVTNLGADVLDLVPVRDPDDVVTRVERIRVRGGPTQTLEVGTLAGLPVSPRPLLGERVALRWTGYDPRSLDLRFQRLAHARSVDDGVRVLDEAQGIALNVLLTDTAGHMAHLATGLLPGAAGHLAPPERPRRLDPPSGVLVSANDRALPVPARPVEYDPDPGHRARRV